MKQYQRALIILNESTPAKSKHNKLVKLFVEVEETAFKNLLQDLMEAYSLYIEPRWTRNIPLEERQLWKPTNNKEWKELMVHVKKDAFEFLEGRIKQGKPQWQIMAEKNGWAPIRR